MGRLYQMAAFLTAMLAGILTLRNAPVGAIPVAGVVLIRLAIRVGESRAVSPGGWAAVIGDHHR
ncbi:hypothetical protein [Saccharopolyspora halophila]|uniref:hypothetical protein n=1 Tax=Saccharopolyspora halophila TaxID=405551 RepID=UPI0031E47E44